MVKLSNINNWSSTSNRNNGSRSGTAPAFSRQLGPDQQRLAVLPSGESRIMSRRRNTLTLYQQFTGIQWLIDFYPQGKTSINSRFNLPGKWAWALMEAPGFITLLYNMYTLPKELGLGALPWANWTMAGLYVRVCVYLLPLSKLTLICSPSTTSTVLSCPRFASILACRPFIRLSSSQPSHST